MMALIAAIVMFLAGPSYAEEAKAPNELTFKTFYTEVLAYYPKLKKEDADVALAIARKMQAVSGFLPRVQALASVTTGDDPVYVFGTLLRQNAFHEDDFATSRLNTPRSRANYSFSLTGEMPIFDALQTISRTRTATLTAEAAKNEEKFVRTEAFLVATDIYVRTMALEKVLSLAEKVTGDSEADIKQAQDLKEKGVIFGADYFSARMMFGGVSRMRNRLFREKQSLHVLMNILMGREPLGEFELAGGLKDISDDDRPLQDWFDEAESSREDLLAADKAVKAQAAEVDREKYTILPKISAFGSIEEDTHSLDSNGGQNYIMGFKGTMDLCDPSYPARIKAAQETLRKLEYDKLMLKDAIKRDLSEEFSRYQAARDNASIVKSMFEDGTEAIKLMAPLYSEGRKSIADLLEIRSSYLNAASGYYGLLAERDTSRVRMLFLSGKLNEEEMTEASERIGE